MKISNLIHKSWFNCLDDCVVTILNWNRLEYIPIFSKSWRICSWIDGSVAKDYELQPNTVNMKYLLEKYCGRKMIEKFFDSTDELRHFVAECLEKQIPVIIGMDMFYFPWSQFYKEIHSPHYIIITDIQDDSYIVTDVTQNVVDVKLDIADVSMVINAYVMEEIDEPKTAWDSFELLRDSQVQLKLDIVNNNGFNRMKVFARNEFLDKKNVYKEGVDVENMPFTRYLLALSRGRISTAKVLSYIKHDYFSETVEELTYIGTQWGSLRLQIMKSFLQDNWGEMAPEFSKAMIQLIEKEERIYDSFMKLNQEESKNTEKSKEANALDVELINVNLSKFFNNHGFLKNYDGGQSDGKKSDNEEGFDRCGYFYLDREAADQTITSESGAFLSINSGYDNIGCNGEEIPLHKDNILGIRIVGSSEMGNFSEKLNIIFPDEREEFFLHFSDWMEEGGIFNEKTVGHYDCFYKKSNRIVGNCYLFENIFTWNKRRIEKVILPKCIHMHIFSIQLLTKEESRKGFDCR